jgi:hypothetical protein
MRIEDFANWASGFVGLMLALTLCGQYPHPYAIKKMAREYESFCFDNRQMTKSNYCKNLHGRRWSA